MNPTNLTDEGLSELSNKLYDVTQNNGKSDSIFSILSELRQVRDAAKKEERERCAKVAEKQEKGFWLGHKVLPDVATLTIIATAIRQRDQNKEDL